MRIQFALLMVCFSILFNGCNSIRFNNFHKQKFTHLSIKKEHNDTSELVSLKKEDPKNYVNSILPNTTSTDPESLWGDSLLGRKTFFLEDPNGQQAVVRPSQIIVDQPKFQVHKFPIHLNKNLTDQLTRYEHRNSFPTNAAAKDTQLAGTIFLALGIICLILILVGLFIFFVDIYFAIVIPLFAVTTALGLFLLIKSYNHRNEVVKKNEKSSKNPKEKGINDRVKLFKKLLFWSFITLVGAVGIGVLSWKFGWMLDIVMQFLALLSFLAIIVFLIALLVSLQK